MKRYVLVACLLFVLSTPSCQTSDFVVKRVASTETRFPDDASCRDSANKYSPGAIPISDPSQPLVYSFAKGSGEAKEEVLFKTSSQLPKTITYYEITTNPGGNDAENIKILKRVYNSLMKPGILDSVRGPQRDKFKANKKYPCRAILNAKIPFPLNVGGSKNKNNLVSVKGEFGLIINPPYPP